MENGLETIQNNMLQIANQMKVMEPEMQRLMSTPKTAAG